MPSSCNVLYIRLLVAHFNAALTPVLYAIFSEKYRQGFGEIFSQLACQVFVVHGAISFLMLFALETVEVMS